MFQATPAPYQASTNGAQDRQEINIPPQQQHQERRRYVSYSDDDSLPELVIKVILALIQSAYSLTMFVIIILTFTYIKDMKEQIGDMSNNINSINNVIHNITNTSMNT
jgi:hypothetical protein